jgi:hypothetical protein
VKDERKEPEINIIIDTEEVEILDSEDLDSIQEMQSKDTPIDRESDSLT